MTIYCYGMICPSTVYLLKKGSSYPKANGYGEVDRIIQSVGGEAANTAIMLSKLGISSVLDGTWIIKDKFKIVEDILKNFNIDIGGVRSTNENGPSEILIADGLNRTCFGNFDTYQDDGPKWNKPNYSDILKSDYVALDPYFKSETLDIANFCINNSIPFVSLDSNYDSIVATKSEVITISQDHRDWNYSDIDPSELFNRYQENCQGLVIFTFGKDEIWFGRKGEEIKKFKPFDIEPVDTTAAGDTFRAGIIYSLINNYTDEELVRFSSAVSACVCLSVPHAINAADINGIKRFLVKGHL